MIVISEVIIIIIELLKDQIIEILETGEYSLITCKVNIDAGYV